MYETALKAQICNFFETLADEINLIWSARWGAGKVLFLVVRYGAWPVMIVSLFGELLLTSGGYHSQHHDCV